MSTPEAVSPSSEETPVVLDAHWPPEIWRRKVLLFAPSALAWVIGVAVTLIFRSGSALAVIGIGTLICPHLGMLLWHGSIYRSFRSGNADLDKGREGGGSSYWVLGKGEESVGVFTPRDASASIFVHTTTDAGSKKTGCLRLQCLHGKDGAELLANPIAVAQAILCAVVVISIPTGHGMLIYVLYPLIAASVLTMFVWRAFLSSPWGSIDLSHDGAQWTTWVSSPDGRRATTSSLYDIAVTEGGLALTLASKNGEPMEPLLVALPGGSLSQEVQAELAVRAFRQWIAIPITMRPESPEDPGNAAAGSDEDRTRPVPRRAPEPLELTDPRYSHSERRRAAVRAARRKARR